MTDTIRTAAVEGLLDDVTQTHRRNKVWVLILELAPTDKQKSVTPSRSHSLMDAKHLYSTSASNKRLTKQYFFSFSANCSHLYWASLCPPHSTPRSPGTVTVCCHGDCLPDPSTANSMMTEIVTIRNTSYQTVMTVLASRFRPRHTSCTACSKLFLLYEYKTTSTGTTTHACVCQQ